MPLGQEQNRLQTEGLEANGPAVEKQLSQVLENGQMDFNLDAVFYASAALRLRIPRSSGHPFHEHLTTDSTVIRPPIPRVSDH